MAINNTRGFGIFEGYEGINLPRRATALSAGYDLESAADVVLERGRIVLVPTGLKAFMHEDEFLAIYIRSSLALRHGIILVNGVGVIDADYEGELLLPLMRLLDGEFRIEKGMRVAQGIFRKYLTVDGDRIGVGVKRHGGFGSTDGHREQNL
ncbi:MAG: dUTP diphosphatase [Selenomonadaceae bacterium]|nr:dUTP diphosphatase [Selenomonadaceae bacterium]